MNGEPANQSDDIFESVFQAFAQHSIRDEDDSAKQRQTTQVVLPILLLF